MLVLSYTAAYLTDKMVWVVPTLAAAGFFAGTISLDQQTLRRRQDEDDTAETTEYEPLENALEIDATDTE